MLKALTEAGVRTSLGEAGIERVLHFARMYLGLELAYITRLDGSEHVIEFVDGAADRFGMYNGSGTPLLIAPAVLAGQVPLAVPDLDERDVPALAAARRNGVRAYVAAPLRLPDGRIYGVVACVSSQPQPGMRRREANFLHLAAALLSPSITGLADAKHRRAYLGACVQSVLDQGGPAMVYQPIWTLTDGVPVAVEALARFPQCPPDPSGRVVSPATPAEWFDAADEVGLRAELEIAAVRAALRAHDVLDPDIAVSVNVSVPTFEHPELFDALHNGNPHRVIVEITERFPVPDYGAMIAVCQRLRATGFRIAVDDAGAGYAGFRHLIELRPDIIKLDYEITHHLDVDVARSAMADALVGFARAIGSTVLAEGIETSTELDAVAKLGIHHVQGFYLGRPEPLGVAHVPSWARPPVHKIGTVDALGHGLAVLRPA